MRRALGLLVASSATLALAACAPRMAPAPVAPPSPDPAAPVAETRPAAGATVAERLTTPSVCTIRDLGLAPGAIGALRLEEGLVLEARSAEMGGLSALARRDDDRLLAVIDQARLVKIVLWSPATPDGSRGMCVMRDLADAAGPLIGSHADSEGAAWRDAETLLVSFERVPRVQAFAVGPEDQAPPAPVRAVGTPVDFAGLGIDDNESLEALAVLPSGALLAGAETPTILGRPHPVWRLASRAATAPGAGGAPYAPPSAPAFRIATEPGFGLVDFAVTPHGGLIVLERFSTEATGARIRIGWLPPGVAETADDVVRPVTLARLNGGSDVPVDNFEGALALSGPGGLTTLWIVSDDNFNPAQRTLLYRFSFDEAALLEQPDS